MEKNELETKARLLLIVKGKMDSLNAIFGYGLENMTDSERAGVFARINQVVSTLPDERMPKILEMGYGLANGQRCTYGKVAKELDLSPERIRQLHAKALRMLRYKANFILHGEVDLVSVGLLRSEDYKKIDKTTTVSKLMEELKSGIEIEELGLSVRSYNCLKRAGLNTLQDLINLYAEKGEEGFIHPSIRNLGRKSFEEVLAKMSMYCDLSKYSQGIVSNDSDAVNPAD